MDAPGKLLASGRDSDIYECGPRRVLRRSRGGRSQALEARTMEHVRQAGYPAPEVFDLSDDETELVMERIEGLSMLAHLSSRPWLLRADSRGLAGLHKRLHEMPAPEWVRAAPGSAGDRLLHLDLHPMNVVMSPGGPVVIDWTNAAAGQPGTDVAVSWILMGAGEIPGSRVKVAVLGRFRAALVRSFLSNFDLAEVRAELAAVVEWKCLDPHMSAAEQAIMRRLAETDGRG